MAFAQPPSALLYPHACNVWRRTETLDGSGRPTYSMALVYSDEPCYFRTGESVKAPAGGILRDEQDNMDSLDVVSFASTADIQDDDELKQTTGPDVGAFFKVRGDPKFRTTFATKQTVRASRLPAPSTGVS